MKIITGKTGTNHVTSDDDRHLHAGICGVESYVLKTGTQFDASIESTTTIKIGSGDLIHNGIHARIPYGTSDTVAIEAGTSGYNRKDLIVARYTNNSGIEDMQIVVLKGTPTKGTATVPDHVSGNVLDGALISDMPLYVVSLTGVNITSVQAQFEVLLSIKDIIVNYATGKEVSTAIQDISSSLSSLQADVATMQGDISDANAHISGIEDDISKINSAITDIQKRVTALENTVNPGELG